MSALLNWILGWPILNLIFNAPAVDGATLEIFFLHMFKTYMGLVVVTSIVVPANLFICIFALKRKNMLLEEIEDMDKTKVLLKEIFSKNN